MIYPEVISVFLIIFPIFFSLYIIRLASYYLRNLIE